MIKPSLFTKKKPLPTLCELAVKATEHRVRLAEGDVDYWRHRQMFSLADEPVAYEVERAERGLARARQDLAEVERWTR